MRPLLALVLLSLPATFVVGHAETDALAPLRFLIGAWQAVDTPPGESGSSRFVPGVQGHVIVRTNQAVYDATANRPASTHDDLMVIYTENGAIKADYFDNEGHVIRYAVRPEPDGAIVFLSDVKAGEPRFRLTYREQNGVLLGLFEIAPPGMPDQFKTYLSWTARRT